jgi:LacI family transcriptional regulator
LIVRARAGEDPELAVRKLREHRVAGIIVVAPSLEEDGGVADALRRFPPVVSLNHIDGGGIAVVGSNHAATGTVAAEHLLALGHQQIATITGPPGRRVVQSRHRGFKEALAAARVPLPARRVRAADWTPAAAYAAVDPMLGNDPTITAFFVHSDVMAVGVLRALHDHGRQIPDDYSIVGCDDLQAASYTIPSLTTVRVPFEETGDRAAKVLLQLVRGETPPAQVLLPIQLVVRHSTAAARTHDLPPPIASREKVPL